MSHGYASIVTRDASIVTGDALIVTGDKSIATRDASVHKLIKRKLLTIGAPLTTM